MKKEGRRRGNGRQDKVRLEKEIRVDGCTRERWLEKEGEEKV
jgi:hypothetical protein